MLDIIAARRGRSRPAVPLVLQLCIVLLLTLVALRPVGAATLMAGGTPAAGDLAGTVTDSASGQPLVGAEVSVMQGGRIVVNLNTDDFGRFTAHDLAPGAYDVAVHYIGYRPMVRHLTVPESGDAPRSDFRMVSAPVNLGAVEVRASIPLAIDTRTGTQVFQENQYHGAPTNTTSQILQQTITGAVRAPTGEVHIRGQHAEYTYYVDGVPVPAGISGSLNELFDPQVVNQISFITGGWDAEYGNKNAAVVNVSTKIPAGGFHLDASSYAGSFASRGGSLALSTNAGRLGLFAAGSYATTDMRREPVSFDTTTFEPLNFHNHGEDLFGFGKVQYSIGSRDMMTLDLNWSQTRFQVPFDSTGGASLDDRETDRNGFANLAWHHQFGDTTLANTAQPSELFVGAFLRGGSLDYVPGADNVPQFYFYPDTTTAYNLSEARSFTTGGLKLDYLFRPRHGLEAKTGFLGQWTTGHENFQSRDAQGAAGPGSVAALSGHDLGGYAQVAYSPREWLELRTGVRYDAHTAPFAGTQSQWSPRVRLNFFPSPATSFYLYYGRLFMPTNVEDLRAITTSALGEAVTPVPTVPERDDFYEAGLVHRFPFAGLVTKLAGYYKASSPGIDDATIPGSAIVTSVNIQQILTRGVEATVQLRPSGPFSGYVNAALSHAVGKGIVSGAFLQIEPPAGYFDLDHDQRLSIVASGTYAPNRFYVSVTNTYGSGLTNGRDPADAPDAAYGTGLLAWNRAFKVKPSNIVDLGMGYSFTTAGGVVRPELTIENLFDEHYLLKGAFFSGASVGRPRSIVLRVDVGI